MDRPSQTVCTSIHRRSFLKTIAAATGLAGMPRASWSAGASQPAEPPAVGDASAQGATALAPYVADAGVWIRCGDGLFACYRHGTGQKYPYLYPIVGPATGLSLTDETALPWPHHRSFFFACDRVNGANYWQEANARGQIVSGGPKVETTGDAIVLTDTCEWRSPEGPVVMQDDRRYRFAVLDAGTRTIDFEVTLTARTDIHITPTNHSLCAIRATRGISPLGGGTLVNAAGQTSEKGTFGQAAAWCGFQGSRLGQVESLVLMDHPGNPWSPCQWFTRDYGFASPTPFYWIDQAGWRLLAGKSVRMRYRLTALAGPIAPDRVNAVYRRFAELG